MSEGADVARQLKALLPQYADEFESIAEDFDGIETDFSECDKSLKKLNSCFH